MINECWTPLTVKKSYGYLFLHINIILLEICYLGGLELTMEAQKGIKSSKLPASSVGICTG